MVSQQSKSFEPERILVWASGKVAAVPEVEPTPEIGLRWRSDYINGIGRRNDGFVIIFNLPNLFSHEEAMLIDRTGARRPDGSATGSAMGQTAA